VHLPAPSTEIPVPQDVKLSNLAPEPCEPLEIMIESAFMILFNK
jgi:hypothetical protein